MLERNIMIVDDFREAEEETIEEYLAIYEQIQMKNSLPYKLNFIWEDSIDGAIVNLNKKTGVIDVLLIDYDFSNDPKGRKGIELVRRVRESINKRCKIVFYTMNGWASLDETELIYLINNDVFRFLSKSGESLQLKYEETDGEKADQLIVEAIIEALDAADPISNALEKYLINYYDIIKNTSININNEEYPIQKIIDSIRLYTEPGNTFVSNLLETAILDYLEIE